MIEEVKKKVLEILEKDDSGHGIEHVLRVYRLAIKFAEKENANVDIVGLAALLHDVDDYKIVGLKNALNLTNAKEIMKSLSIPLNIEEQVIEIIKTMGYSKYLRGIRPETLEGMIVSDADMCDAIGSNGIIRSIVYAVSSKGNGRIFDKDIYPNVNITAEEYNKTGTTYETDGAINHMFENLLKLKNLMMTESGKEEAIKRQAIMISFLRQFFFEENVPEWSDFLEEYLADLNEEKISRIRNLY